MAGCIVVQKNARTGPDRKPPTDLELIVTVESERGPFPVNGLPWPFGKTPCDLQPLTEPSHDTPAVIERTGRDPGTIPNAMDTSATCIDAADQISHPV